MSALVTLGPIFLLIALGYGMRRAGFPGAGFWGPAEGLTYYVLFPALIFRALAGAPTAALAPGGLWVALAFAAIAMAAIVLVLGRLCGIRGGALGSLAQGSFRFNTYVGMTAVGALWGAPGITEAAVYLVVMVPLGNLLAILFLAGGEGGATDRLARILAEIAMNPLVVACALGIAANLAGFALPGPVAATVDFLARAALPLGLLCVGAGLMFAAIPSGGLALGLACVLKLAAMPALTAGACAALGLGGLAASVAILFNATPAAPTAYVLARRLGGDAPLMAAILTAQTVAAAVTLPILVAWL